MWLLPLWQEEEEGRLLNESAGNALYEVIAITQDLGLEQLAISTIIMDKKKKLVMHSNHLP